MKIMPPITSVSKDPLKTIGQGDASTRWKG